MAYEDIIKEAARSESDEPISNSSIEHAEIAIRQLLSSTKKAARVVCGDFYYPFWVKLQKDLRQFLGKSLENEVNVIVKEEDAPGISLLGLLCSTYPNQVHVWICSREQYVEVLGKKTVDNPFTPDFVVTDRSGYRLEFEDEQRDMGLVRGVVNFGDSPFAKDLRTLFEKLCLKGQPLTFPNAV